MLEKELKINTNQIKRLYEILLSDDVVKSINNNIEYLENNYYDNSIHYKK